MKIILFTAFLCCMSGKAQSQDSTQAANNGEAQNVSTEKVYSIFKSTRVINAHSVDMLHKGNLDFRILHRFGFLSKGIKEMFGLDEASMRMSFDYGITDNITIGIGRSTYRKELDGFFKWRLIQQSTGENSNPFSLALAAGSTVWTEKSFATPKPSFADRFSYYVQVLAGKKFNSIFSMQLSPIFVHSNAPINGDARNIFAPGLGMRYKISNRLALTFDYHHILDGLTNISRHPLSVGVDIQTGGHIFQLHFSNATGMNERALLYETYGKFFEGDIRFGFNLSRMFHLNNR
ncbi:MAG TPA: DUF5777 family beta-barrel protein [Ferruginibacter sp.]|nr:DUF5777 family beta-barrel protein [Ferruginibacter sp.]